MLSWYLLHIDDPYSPRILTAKAFVAKRHQIRQAWIDDPGSIEITQHAYKILARSIEENTWKQGMLTILPAVIQRSLDNYTAWWQGPSGIGRFAYTGPGGRELPEFEDRLFLRMYTIGMLIRSNPYDFVRYTWMRLLHAKFGWMDNSKIGKLVFVPDSTVFLDAGDELAFEWCGKQGRFRKLMEMLK